MADTITPEAAFETLKNNVTDTISSYFPYEGKRQKVVLNKIWVDDKSDIDDIRGQADTRDKEGTWGVPVKANISLVDVATGKVVDQKNGAVLARLPKLTSRYGFIVNGSEYQVDHLFRLKSGVYARVQDNGDLESEFNLAKSPTGRGFSIKLDRQKKLFQLKLGDAHIPLYPVLKSMGVSDEQLEHEWGKEIFAANRPKNEDKFNKALASFHDKTADEGEPTPKSFDEHAKYINDFFDKTALLPDTTGITLGKPFTKVNGEALRLAANKILGVAKGTHEPDDRDSLAFKEVVSVEDFIPEKIQRNSRTVRSRLRQNVDHKTSIGEIVTTDLFNRPVNEFFSKGGSLSERSDQTNPLQMLNAHRKTTLMAKDFGGIKNENSLTTEMRVINPSHFGFLDPTHTPEGERTGITLHLSSTARKNGRQLETQAFNVKTGKFEYVNVPVFHQAMAVLPDQVRWVKGKPVPVSPEVKVKLPGGAIEKRPFKEADYVIPSAKGVFDYSSNLIPFLPSIQGNRTSMANKQMEQAISLKHREAPMVQSRTDSADPNHTFEKWVGSFTATKTHVAGKVVAINPDGIIVHDGKKKHEVQIYNHFPLNDPKGMMHSEPLVKVGDTVKEGQIVADTNYTKQGHLALGTNLRVAYIPYKGYNYEDGIVISESAAKKLTSEHLYKKDIELDPEQDHISKSKFQAHSATKWANLSKEQKESLDEDGVVKVGSKVTSGSILIAAVGKNNVAKSGHALAALGKRAISPFKDKSLVWDEDHVGTVVKVIKDPNGRGAKVYVKTEEQAVVGDKLTGRHGNKGIITMILPDHEMPFTKDGEEPKHVDVVLNPHGVPSRINPSQMLETAAAKIAEKTGKPYLVDNFSGPNHDYRKQVEDDLKKAGISDEEHIFDPKNPKRALGSVIVGPQYLLKLKHQVEKKLSVRGGGTDLQGKPLPIDADRQPSKGGEHGGQGFGQLDVYALLGHNARHNIREMATYKSDQQDVMFWNMIQEGHEPPPPKAPFSYEKFTTLLKGLGVNVAREGTQVRLAPMTDHEIVKMGGGAKGMLSNPHLAILSKNLKEERGGLFDPLATGGLNGDKWSYIKISEPLPNPIFVGQNNRPGPIPTLLGLKTSGKVNELDLIMRGQMKLEGKTGGAAIEAALKKIDVEKEITDLKTKLPSLKAADLDRANRKLKYLLALKETGLRPHEAYLLRNLPVIPPKFRPASQTNTGDVTYAPINGLYKNFAILNQKLEEASDPKYPDELKHAVRADLWDSFKALQSVGRFKNVYDMDSHGQRKLKGILDGIGGGGEGEQPKDGYFQSKLVKRRQNLSIRSTIVPEPALGIDELGLPKNAAMELYKPFVVAQLHKWGLDPLTAQREMREAVSSGNAGSMAYKALEKAVSERPMLLKRDPALHKFSIMAFKPRLIEGKAIQIHPLVCGGFNADFDGDTMAGTVPLSKEAVEEAKKMFPSANLFSPTSGRVMYAPNQEAMLGLHLLGKWGKESGKSFSSVGELAKAVEAGKLHPTDVVKVSGFAKPTTYGRILIESRLPRGFGMSKDILHEGTFDVTKKSMNQIAEKLAKEHNSQFAKTVDELKNLGNEQVYQFGFSFGLKDLKPVAARDPILARANKEADSAKSTIKDRTLLEKRLVEIYQGATSELDKATKEELTKNGNRLALMVYAGSKGKAEQLRQIVAAPMLMQDSTNRTIPTPVTRSYAEGLDLGDYWLAQHGARKGTLQRAQGSSEPGAVTKDILNSTMSTLIASKDCGTTQGVLMDLVHKDVHDRYTAIPYKLKDGTNIKSGELITPELANRLKNSKIDKVLVRSPLKCQHGDGICAKCYGLNENGKLHDVGVNIGVLAGSAMGEPALQMSMDAFHTGGLAGEGRGARSVDRITRLRNLLEMPKKLKDEATVAVAAGKIDSVKKDAAGGVDIFINGVRHYVPRHLVKEDLKPGMEIKKGDKLSEGYVNPHALLSATKDIHAVQNYMTNELYHGLYEKEDVRRRNIEVAVRAVTNLTKVVDPGHSDHNYGDVLPRSVIEEYNRNLPKGKKPISHEPILKGIEQVPSHISSDWMARLNYRELHSTIQQGASQGWKSELHGSHPIPGIAHGAEFGKPPPGKPPHVY